MKPTGPLSSVATRRRRPPRAPSRDGAARLPLGRERRTTEMQHEQRERHVEDDRAREGEEERTGGHDEDGQRRGQRAVVAPAGRQRGDQESRGRRAPTAGARPIRSARRRAGRGRRL